MRLTTLRGTKAAFVTPERYDGHPRPILGVLPGDLTKSKKKRKKHGITVSERKKRTAQLSICVYLTVLAGSSNGGKNGGLN